MPEVPAAESTSTETPFKRRFGAPALKLHKLQSGLLYSVGTAEFESELSTLMTENPQILRGGFLNIELEHPGSLVFYDKSSRAAYLFADIIGLFPLYWSIKDGRINVSSSLHEIGRTLSSGFDDAGLFAFVLDGYCIGSRTIFRDIRCLRPGESIRFEPESQQVFSADLSRLWVGKPETENIRKLCDIATELTKAACSTMPSTMLMMSGGWDSRTLLAGAIAAKVAPSVLLYHHGDVESRESRIVKSIADRLKMTLEMRTIDASAFTVNFLEDSFRKYENVLYPDWHRAAIAADQASNVRSITAGVFGEILGGHYGTPFIRSGIGKITSTLWYLTLGTGTESDITSPGVQETIEFLRQSPYRRPWYMAEEPWGAHFETIHEQINEDIVETINRYQARGIFGQERLVEAFISEHRGSQYICSQLRSAAIHKAPVAPFCLRSYIQFACAVPFAAKANNSLNRAIIRRLAPDLLKYPTGAILCRASRPILLQETSRALRKVLENTGWILRRKSNEKIPLYRWGWVNYQFLQDDRTLHEVVASLKSPVWDKAGIINRIESSRFKNFHSVANMLMKIKTLDLMGQSPK